jgi:hypothetical protein
MAPSGVSKCGVGGAVVATLVVGGAVDGASDRMDEVLPAARSVVAVRPLPQAVRAAAPMTVKATTASRFIKVERPVV